jgi:hypothetical protein
MVACWRRFPETMMSDHAMISEILRQDGRRLAEELRRSLVPDGAGRDEWGRVAAILDNIIRGFQEFPAGRTEQFLFFSYGAVVEMNRWVAMAMTAGHLGPSTGRRMLHQGSELLRKMVPGLNPLEH